MRIPTIGAAIGAVLVALLSPSAGLAQEAASGGKRPTMEQEGEHEDKAKAVASYDLLASKIFRSVSAVVPISNRISAEVHAFGRSEEEGRENVVQSTVSYQLPLGHFGFIAPGAGYYFGTDHSMFSASLRWMAEVGPVVTEGFLLQGISEPEEGKRAQIWDGNHVSLALLDRKLEVGPTWEYIGIRDEDEWKWGGRAAVRVHKRIVLQMNVLAPGETEWRAGFLIR